jgi:hypothetical protein
MTGENNSLEITTNPLAFLADSKTRFAYENAPEELRKMSEIDLFKTGNIGEKDYFLRKNLWKSVENAQKRGVFSITEASIYSDVMSAQGYYNRFLANPHRVCWMMTPPIDAKEIMEEALFFGLSRLRNELLTMPINERTAPSMLKAIEFLANRTWGPVIQKIEAKHAHLNMNKPMAVHDARDVNKRLDELKAKLIEVPATQDESINEEQGQ